MRSHALFLVFSLAILLSGCSYTHQMQSLLQSTANTEMAAWQKAQEISKTTCPKGENGQPLPRKQIAEKMQCVDSIIEQYVVPVAMAPDLLDQYRATIKEIMTGYKNGKFDGEKEKAKEKQAWNRYMNALNQRVQDAINEAQRKDRQRQEAAQKSMNSFYAATHPTSVAPEKAQQETERICHLQNGRTVEQQQAEYQKCYQQTYPQLLQTYMQAAEQQEQALNPPPTPMAPSYNCVNTGRGTASCNPF